MNQYEPDYVSAPGETLKELCFETQMTYRELSNLLGISIDEVDSLFEGKIPLTGEHCIAIHKLFPGIPYSFWMRRKRGRI